MTVIPLETTCEGFAQATEEVNVQVTVCPLVKVEDENVEVVTPVEILSILQRYCGVPPLVGVAVNVMGVPAQLVAEPEVTAMETAGTTAAWMFTNIEFDTSVSGLAHVAFDVITQVTT